MGRASVGADRAHFVPARGGRRGNQYAYAAAGAWTYARGLRTGAFRSRGIQRVGARSIYYRFAQHGSRPGRLRGRSRFEIRDAAGMPDNGRAGNGAESRSFAAQLESGAQLRPRDRYRLRLLAVARNHFVARTLGAATWDNRGMAAELHVCDDRDVDIPVRRRALSR